MDSDFKLFVMQPGTVSRQPETRLADDGLELQSAGTALIQLLNGAKEVPGERFRKSWENTHGALLIMIEQSKAKEQAGFRLEELEVSLTISGEGDIAFVSAKAEASIVLKFKRG